MTNNIDNTNNNIDNSIENTNNIDDNKIIIEEDIITENENEEVVNNNYILDYICDNSEKVFLINTIFIFLFFVVLLTTTILFNPDLDYLFFVNQGSKYILVLCIQYVMALLVIKYNVKVNYTRKVIHMSYFLWPQILDKELLEYKKNKYTEFWNVWIVLFLLLMISEEVRKRISFINTMFKAVDRPEDKPYTLIWFSSQIIFTLIILLPFSVYFSRIEEINLIFIPILINALADGLAEPVGIKFGKNKYKTKACLSSKEYERSYEGSFCVFIVSFIIIICYFSYMIINQFIFCLMTIPILTTYTEAYSPHTWDSPLITLVVSSILCISTLIKE